MVETLALILTFSPEEKEQHSHISGFRMPSSESRQLSARAALAASGALPENVNYAVKSSFLLGFLESVPELLAEAHQGEVERAGSDGAEI